MECVTFIVTIYQNNLIKIEYHIIKVDQAERVSRKWDEIFFTNKICKIIQKY